MPGSPAAARTHRPHARQRVRLARHTVQAHGHLAQQRVTCGMALHVVDGLESVQIDVQQAHAHRPAGPWLLHRAVGARNRPAKPVLEQRPVGRAGQRVPEGDALELHIGAQQLFIGLLQRLRQALSLLAQAHMDHQRNQQEYQNGNGAPQAESAPPAAQLPWPSDGADAARSSPPASARHCARPSSSAARDGPRRRTAVRRNTAWVMNRQRTGDIRSSRDIASSC